MTAYAVGYRLPDLAGPAITRLRIAYMAVAMRDPNPVHFEDDVAHRSGLPGPIAHGTFPLAYLAAAVTRAAGIDALRTFTAALTAPVFPGDQLTTGATVAAVDGDEVTVDVVVAKADGTAVARGRATFTTAGAVAAAPAASR